MSCVCVCEILRGKRGNLLCVALYYFFVLPSILRPRLIMREQVLSAAYKSLFISVNGKKRIERAGGVWAYNKSKPDLFSPFLHPQHWPCQIKTTILKVATDSNNIDILLIDESCFCAWKVKQAINRKIFIPILKLYPVFICNFLNLKL